MVVNVIDRSAALAAPPYRLPNKRQVAPVPHDEMAINSILTPLGDASSGVISQRVGVRMSSLYDTVSSNFADAARGKRLTFAANGPGGVRAAIPALLYAAEHDVFIFSRGLPLAVYSPAVFRDVVARQAAPRIRILIDASEQVDNDALFEVSDLIVPNGPIEVRWSPVSSPVHFVVVDKKHVWLERDSDSEHRIVDLNAVDIARDTLSRLDQLWMLAEPASPPCQPSERLPGTTEA